MALPDGLFKLAGAGITSPGGAYSYLAGTIQPSYFGGELFIDTGYDDPASWSAGLEAAEIYGARVYGATGSYNPGLGAGVYTGRWQVTATPVWSSKFWQTPHGNTVTQQRVFILVRAWLQEPVSTAAGAWQRLETCAWTLYRL